MLILKQPTRVLSRKEQLSSSPATKWNLRKQIFYLLYSYSGNYSFFAFCFETASICMLLIIIYICLCIKLIAETKDEPHTLNTSELKFPTVAQISGVDLNTAHRVLLRCSEKHGFSMWRQTEISFNPVKLHGNRCQQGHSLSWGCARLSLTAGLCCQQRWTRHAGAGSSDCSSSGSHWASRDKDIHKAERGLPENEEVYGFQWHRTKYTSSQSWTRWWKPLECVAVHISIQCQPVFSVSLYLKCPLVKGNYTNIVLPLTSAWGWTIPYIQSTSPAGLISVCLNPHLWGPAPALETACPLSEGMEEVSGNLAWLELLQGKPAQVSTC